MCSSINALDKSADPLITDTFLSHDLTKEEIESILARKSSPRRFPFFAIDGNRPAITQGIYFILDH